MAFKQIKPANSKELATGINVEINITGCTIFSGVTITKGYRSITEIIGHDSETACVVMAGKDNYDVTVNGYVDKDAVLPENGDTCTVEGYEMAWIDGVSVSETPEGATTFTATVHARKKPTTT